MNRYLLDTNHVSAYLDRQPALTQRVDAALRAGDRLGFACPCSVNTGRDLFEGERFNTPS